MTKMTSSSTCGGSPLAVSLFNVGVSAVGAAEDARARLEAADDGCRLFRRIGAAPVVSASIIGPAREGKSTLMNALLGARVFNVSHGSATCTRGIHVSSTMPSWSTFARRPWASSVVEPAVALIDSEGGGCKGEAYDMQVVAPTVILSDCVILNLMSKPQAASICDKLGTLALAASRITSGLADGAADVPKHGHLHIVFRDYDLQVDDPAEPAGSAAALVDIAADPERAGAVVRDWYLGLGRIPIKTVKATLAKSRPQFHNFAIVDKQQLEKLESARSRIIEHFASIHVWLLPNATTNSSAFNARIQYVRAALAGQLAAAAADASGVRRLYSCGTRVAALLPAIAEAVNSGVEELSIDSMFDNALKAETKRAGQHIVAAFAADAATIPNGTPVSQLLAQLNGMGDQACTQLSASLKALGIGASALGAANAELREMLVLAAQADFQRRAERLAAVGTAFALTYVSKIKATADSVLEEFKRCTSVDAVTGVAYVNTSDEGHVQLEAAGKFLRGRIAHDHAAAVRAAAAADAPLVAAGGAPLATADEHLPSAASGLGAEPRIQLLQYEHAAALTRCIDSLKRMIDEELQRRTSEAVAALGAHMMACQRNAAAQKLEEVEKQRQQAMRAAEMEQQARRNAEERERAALAAQQRALEDPQRQRAPAATATMPEYYYALPSYRSSLIAGTGLRYYKGGQFVPGGGHAPKGGCWIQI